MKTVRAAFSVRGFVVVGLLAGFVCLAADWPTYRGDNQRSGVTAEALAFPLAEQWRFRAAHAPSPAWEAPRDVPVEGILELGRVQFDDTYQPVAAAGLVFFATTTDHRIVALDPATGHIRWQHVLGGPVRLAPAVWDNKVYVAADDGWAHCFAATSGEVVWQRLLAPREERILGNGRMISRWPCRTGLLIQDGVGYAGVGIWPAEGVFLEAFDAATGRTLWRNDQLGEASDTFVSPQGYMLTADDLLFVPQGRVSPAAFSRTTGAYVYNQRFGKNVGGTWALIAGDLLYTGTEEIMAFGTKNRARFAWFEGRQLIVSEGRHYTADGKAVAAVQTETYGKPSLERFRLRDTRNTQQQDHRTAQRAVRTAQDRLKTETDKLAAIENDEERARQQVVCDKARATLEAAEKQLDTVAEALAKIEAQWQAAGEGMTAGFGWRTECAAAEALILAGDMLLAGGAGEVVALRASDGTRVWEAKVEGKAKGLAVADGRLLVSTDQGVVYAFGSGAATPAEMRETAAAAPPAPDHDRLAAWLAAEAGLGQRPGFALVLGLADGKLLPALAKATNLTVYGVDPDPAKIAALRRELAGAGLYGSRVCLIAAPLDHTGLANYFADLVTSERAGDGFPYAEAWRVTKPGNGVLLVGPALPPETGAWTPAARSFGNGRFEERGGWLKGRRGPLPGAANWTHQYADAGNTASSKDSFLTCPLRLLWYGLPGPLGMVSRHQRAAAPLAVNGVLFVQCEDWVEAYDAYNGVLLWRRDFPKVVRTGISHDCSNLVADEDSFYVVHRNQCHRLASHTGETLATFAVPAELGEGAWGWVARLDGLLLGSVRSAGRSTNALFAYDVASGNLLWTFQPRNVLHPTLSAGDGRIFLVDDSVDLEQRQEALQKRLRGLEPAYADKLLKDAPVRTVLALDAATGRPVWQRPLDLSGGIGGMYWSSLGTMYQDGVLVVFGIFTDGHYWQDFFAGQFEGRRIVALNARDGGDLWEKEVGYRVRPLIIGDTLHAEPWAYDLRTGARKQRRNPLTGADEPWQFARPGHHCGCPVGSVNALFFRSYYIGYYDLARDGGTVHFSSQRPGCWINFIPANGLLSVPEASSGCMCPFANLSTVVFEPGGEDRTWTKFSLEGATTPIRELCLNLGGPGDRKDARGRLWLAYPRPTGSLVLPLDIQLAAYPGGAAFRNGIDFSRVEGTDLPWLYASGYRGLRRLEIPVMAPGEGAAAYTVRLHFAETEPVADQERRFAIKLQGREVAGGFVPATAAGGAQRAVVREFTGIEAEASIVLELAAGTDQPEPGQTPVLQAVEIVRERVLRVGLAADPVPLLNRRNPQTTAKLRIANHQDTVFAGSLRLQPPPGLRAEPATQDIRVQPGETLTLDLALTADPAALERGTLAVPATLLRADGTAEAALGLAVEYLADRNRVTVPASEDTYVGAAFAGNRATVPKILVDGGDRQMGDHSHNIVYLRFRLDREALGQVHAVRFRIVNGGNPTTDGGRIHRVHDNWDPASLSYQTRPKSGKVVGDIQAVAPNEVVDVPLDLAIGDETEIRLVIEPENCDGVDYLSIEAKAPAELWIEYAE